MQNLAVGLLKRKNGREKNKLLERRSLSLQISCRSIHATTRTGPDKSPNKAAANCRILLKFGIYTMRLRHGVLKCRELSESVSD